MVRFICIVVFILVLNVAYAGLMIYLLRRRHPWPRWIGYAVGGWTLAMAAFFLLDIAAPVEWEDFLRRWFYLPLAVQVIWNVLFIEFLFLGLVLAVLLVRRTRPVQRGDQLTPAGLSRRRFLYVVCCGAAPVTALGMGVYGAASRDDLRVRTLDIPIANLPPELEGFTIAHVSDLHAGLFVGPERLKQIRDATNDLKPGLVAITGDIINSQMEEFPSALTAIHGMEAKHGLVLCEGNHDRIPGPDEGVSYLVRACWDNRLDMLYNACRSVTVEGRTIHIAGLPWMKRGFEGHPEIVDQLYPARKEGDVRILLAHHPHLFEIAEHTDLVLAGHTHGGQLMVGPIGIGPVFFRYWSGPYRHGSTSLVVSNGCGDWFPCRIGAPAEIGLLKLTKAA
jgi:predicted MPP superfamily phosphohydrolase